MMTYILIGVLIILFLAILFTLRNDESKSKKIEKLQSFIKVLEHEKDHLQAQCECLTNDNSELVSEIFDLKKETDIWKEYSNNLQKETEVVSLAFQELSDGQLERFEQLVADCKKPFTRSKHPINVGGKFTRGTIISVGGVIQAIKNFNERAAQ